MFVPNTVSYIKGENIDYYLNQAGGYSENAKKIKIFIVYMNGQVTKVKGSGKKQIEPDKPPPLLLPISGERVTSTVYCLGILIATITPMMRRSKSI